MSCVTLEGKVEGKDVFLETLNLFPFSDLPVFSSIEHFLTLPPALPHPPHWIFHDENWCVWGVDSEKPVPGAQCPVPAEGSQYHQLQGPRSLPVSALNWVISALLLPLAKAGKSGSDSNLAAGERHGDNVGPSETGIGKGWVWLGLGSLDLTALGWVGV